MCIPAPLQELKGFEEKRGRNRPRGTEHGVHKNRKNWLAMKEEEERTLGFEKQPYCVIIGGGQGGIGLAARLKVLGVPTLVIDKHPRPGDQWRSRYKSLCLHDPVWYDHLPYLPFPDHWPVFCPKDKIGGMPIHTHIMRLCTCPHFACTPANTLCAQHTSHLACMHHSSRLTHTAMSTNIYIFHIIYIYSFIRLARVIYENYGVELLVQYGVFGGNI